MYDSTGVDRLSQEEAKAAMQRLSENPDSLDSSIIGAAVKPPYSVNQMSEAAFQREVETIYRTACKQTRGIYNLTQADNGQNWVIRWMLWHVLQARQDEDLRATSSAGETDCSAASPQSAKLAWSPRSYSTAKTSPMYTTATTSLHDTSDSDDWDAEYEVKVRVKRESRAEEAKTPETPRKSAFWDHVMT